MRTYLDPKVNLIDKTQYDLAFYVWLKSRKHVIKMTDGTPIKDVELDGADRSCLYFDDDYCIMFKGQDDSMYLLVPKIKYDLSSEYRRRHYIYQFYVDNELVDYKEYRKRIIERLNLQFNNFPQYVFEITGSALFRDLLYNVNWNAAWARSERFRVSTLNKEDRLLEENYPISSEYKDIPEWEEQFDEYMRYLNKYEKTDDARLAMPYSISSVYWVSINHKTLVNLASMVKSKMPFFYDIYIKKMIECVGISESILDTRFVDSHISMYFNDQSDWKEGSSYNSGFYTINSKMGLIMFSQFLRQGGTTISGFYNELEHDDIESFKHKVFKGDTILNVTYNAHKDRVSRTISNRLCAFAMSSGDGPCSWSYFLNNFLPDNMTVEQFKNLLPCKFGKDEKVCECKFLDDVKFRNSGTEISNDPCPLPSASMELAERKKKTDHNKIGNFYYEIVKKMNEK